MKSVATIISGDKFNFNQKEADHIIDALSNSGAIVESIDWLSKDKAIDINFAVLTPDEGREILDELLKDFDIDHIVQANSSRRKKLLVMDMDSTVIEQECIDELADCLGIKPQIAAITEKAMNGELDFPAALRERVALLKGLPESKLQEVYDNRITYTKGVHALTATMKANGARCILVSGGFTFFTNRVGKNAGFDVDESNILEIENGQLTGKVRAPILDSRSKLNALLFHCEEMDIKPFMSCAVGDGANDVPMLKQAGLGIGFRAREKVKKEITHNLKVPDLRNVLYAQGYKDTEIVG